jgi:putative spermidine/putrescine transport system permease protein
MDRIEEALRVATGGWRNVFLAGGLAAAVFLLLPIAVIVPTAFSDGNFLGFPPDGLSLRWFEEVTSDPVWTSAFWTSAKLAAGAAAIATVVGTLAALAVRRLGPRGRLLRACFIAPLVLPYIVYALGLYNVFDGLRMLGQSWTIAVGQAALAFPIVFVAVSAGLAAVDPALARAAASLGARWPRIVLRIELPLALPSVVAAALFAFAFSFDEVVVALFLADPASTTLPVQMFTSVQESVTPAVAAASTVVMALALAIAGVGTSIVVRRATRKGRA